MAILIGLTGQEGRVNPWSGSQFTRDEVQGLLEALDLETVDIGHGRVLIFDGKGYTKPVNHRASDLARGHGYGYSVNGFVLNAERKELSWLQNSGV